MELSQEQKNFYNTFGYVVMPGLVRDSIEWISSEFEAVFTDRGVQHDGSRRSVIVPFIDQREKLCTLLDHPGVDGLIRGLLGEEFNYLGGDGNFYTGDTRWHSDGFHSIGHYLKVAFYLDPVGKDSGCLRVIPGSQRVDLFDKWDARKARESESLWATAQNQVPAIPLESQPGDVVAFNHNLMHAAFDRPHPFGGDAPHGLAPADAPPAPGDGTRGPSAHPVRQSQGGDGRAGAGLGRNSRKSANENS
jgi:hypothetical protein